MNTSTKALLIIVAVAAFGIGWLVNSAYVESPDQFNTQALLSAKLLQGTPEDLQSIEVKETLKSLTLVNFWATWCAPCREEMPMFQAMYQQHVEQGFQVLGIAIDNPEASQPMLDSMGITYPILYAEQTGMEIMSTVGNPNGLLPYSLLIDASGKVLEQKLGTVHEEDILAWLNQHRL